VRELKGQPEEAPSEVKIAIPQDAYLPSDYIPDTMARLNLYKRIAAVQKHAELESLSQEVAARFGTPPLPAQTLLNVADLKLTARQAGIREIVVGERVVVLKWPELYRPKPSLVEQLLADRKRRLRFIPGANPALEIARPSGDLLSGIKNFLSELI
jgi:transcription-repair coupling factor (superfamily II helicase)